MTCDQHYDIGHYLTIINHYILQQMHRIQYSKLHKGILYSLY